MKKLLGLILALTILSSCLALVGCNVFGELFDTTSTQSSTTTTTTGSSSDTGEIVWEEKQYVDLTLRDDFYPGGVIVLLDRRISEPNKVHEKEFFVGVEIEEIVDLTPRSNPVDPDEDFHQILWIVLVDKSKEAVIEASIILMEIQGIVTAHPDYYVYPEIVPNDP